MKKAIIIFTRVPVAGQTKTRLQTVLTPSLCARLHSAFLQDIHAVCQEVEADAYICFTPSDQKMILEDLLGEINSFEQEGHDLGEKMYQAIEFVLSKGYDKCILIGTDVPEITKLDLDEAFDALSKCDLVLGPSLDGGYYLVGMTKPIECVFEKQTYGSGNVLEQTIQSAKRNGLSWKLIKAYLDVDEAGDLEILIARVKQATYRVSYQHTADFINSFL
ncbi:MAG: TIGR04282 family arsenosugar biosynthesis glycosyltransferase [Cellulosilyticaceae bacterium]